MKRGLHLHHTQPVDIEAALQDNSFAGRTPTLAEKAIWIVRQFIRFSGVSFTAFLIDCFLLIYLVSGFKVHYLVANGISFTVSIIYSYILSMRFVYVRKEGMGRGREFVIFAVLSAIGLLLNEFLMWLGTGLIGFGYMFSKIIAGFLVSFWNFGSRKACLDSSTTAQSRTKLR